MRYYVAYRFAQKGKQGKEGWGYCNVWGMLWFNPIKIAERLRKEGNYKIVQISFYKRISIFASKSL